MYPADEELIVLDFFAGSGSTAHAVMKQNAIDGAKALLDFEIQLDEFKGKPAYKMVSKDLRSDREKAGARPRADASKLSDYNYRSLILRDCYPITKRHPNYELICFSSP